MFAEWVHRSSSSVALTFLSTESISLVNLLFSEYMSPGKRQEATRYGLVYLSPLPTGLLNKHCARKKQQMTSVKATILQSFHKVGLCPAASEWRALPSSSACRGLELFLESAPNAKKQYKKACRPSHFRSPRQVICCKWRPRIYTCWMHCMLGPYAVWCFYLSRGETQITFLWIRTE